MRQIIPLVVLALVTAATQVQAQSTQTQAPMPIAASGAATDGPPSATSPPPVGPVTMPSGGGHRSSHSATRLSWEQRFANANTTHDGHLTLAQATAGDASLARHFTAIDQGNKGYITEDDVRAYRKTQRALHHPSEQPKPNNG
jgi:hypothetical protein